MFSFLSDLLRWFKQRLLLTRPSSATAGLPVPDRWRVTWRPPVGRTTGSGDPRPNQLVQGRSLYPKGLVRRWLHRKPLGLSGTGFLKSEKRGVQAARNAPSEDGKCWQRVKLGIHGLNEWAVKCLEMSGKRGVHTARNGPSLPPCVAKAEMTTEDHLGFREGSSRAGPPQGRGVSR